MATAAALNTLGCARIRFSISSAEIFSPPRLIKSFSRPSTTRLPSALRRTTSPRAVVAVGGEGAQVVLGHVVVAANACTDRGRATRRARRRHVVVRPRRRYGSRRPRDTDALRLVRPPRPDRPAGCSSAVLRPCRTPAGPGSPTPGGCVALARRSSFAPPTCSTRKLDRSKSARSGASIHRMASAGTTAVCGDTLLLDQLEHASCIGGVCQTRRVRRPAARSAGRVRREGSCARSAVPRGRRCRSRCRTPRHSRASCTRSRCACAVSAWAARSFRPRAGTRRRRRHRVAPADATRPAPTANAEWTRRRPRSCPRSSATDARPEPRGAAAVRDSGKSKPRSVPGPTYATACENSAR